MNNFDICLVRASLADAKKIWNMQKEAFAELFEKYQDFETSPAAEPLEKTIFRLKQPETYFYMIQLDKQTVGAVRVVDSGNNNRKRISPIFILPKFRNMGIAQKQLYLPRKSMAVKIGSLPQLCRKNATATYMKKWVIELQEKLR